MDAERVIYELQDTDGKIMNLQDFEPWINRDMPVKIVSIRWDNNNLVLTFRSLVPKPGTVSNAGLSVFRKIEIDADETTVQLRSGRTYEEK